MKRQTRPLITLAFTQPASLDTERELRGSTANSRTLSGQVGGGGLSQLLEVLLTAPHGTSFSRYPSYRLGEASANSLPVSDLLTTLLY